MDNSTEPLSHEPQETRPTPLVRGMGRHSSSPGIRVDALSPETQYSLGESRFCRKTSYPRLRVVLPRRRTDIRVNSPIQLSEPQTMALGRLSKLSKIPVHRKILELVGETPLSQSEMRDCETVIVCQLSRSLLRDLTELDFASRT